MSVSHAGVIVIAKSTRKFLVVKHAEGHFGFPKGAIEPEDKDWQAAALRELSEETGVHLSCIYLLPNQRKIEEKYNAPGDMFKFVKYLTAFTNDEIGGELDAEHEYTWKSFEELAELSNFPSFLNTKNVLKDLSLAALHNSAFLNNIENNGLVTALKLEFEKSLQNFDVALLLTGSGAIKRSNSSFINGQSDIDMVMVMNDISAVPMLCTRLGIAKITPVDNFNVIDMEFPYGAGRNKIQIKCMGLDTYKKITSFSRVNIREYRHYSLTKYKPSTYFYSCSSEKPVLEHCYDEKEIDHAFELNQEIKHFTPDNSIILDDWHSKLLVSCIIVDNIEISHSQKNYVSKFISHLDAKPLELRHNIVTYFKEKHGLGYQAFRKQIIANTLH